MNDLYVPSDLSIRIAYADGIAGNQTRAREAAFDRWLLRMKSEIWSEGYKAGNLDGYFGTRDEKNPYTEGDDGERS